MGEGDRLGVRESTWAREASGNPACMGEPIQALGDSSPSLPGQAWREERARSAVKPMLRCTATWRFPMQWHDEL